MRIFFVRCCYCCNFYFVVFKYERRRSDVDSSLVVRHRITYIYSYKYVVCWLTELYAIVCWRFRASNYRYELRVHRLKTWCSSCKLKRRAGKYYGTHIPTSYTIYVKIYISYIVCSNKQQLYCLYFSWISNEL